MDTYFYSVTENNGKKYVEVERNLYDVLDDWYREIKWENLQLSINEVQLLMKNGTLHKRIQGEKSSLKELNEKQVKETLYSYKEERTSLSFFQLTDETPCGKYYSEDEENGLETTHLNLPHGRFYTETWTDGNYNIATLLFETKEGEVVDLARVENSIESNFEEIDILTYDDPYTEDYTRKSSVCITDIEDATSEEK